MKTANRMAQLAAVVAAAMFLCAASALAGDCPELVGVWEDRPAEAVATSGGYAYVWTATFFSVVDVSDPGAPHAVGELVFPDVVRDIAISGSHAYVLTSEALWVIDVSTPSSPTLVWYDDGFLGTSGVAVSTGYVFVYDSGSDGGPPGSNLVVFDVSTHSLPIQEGYCLRVGAFPVGAAASPAVRVRDKRLSHVGGRHGAPSFPSSWNPGTRRSAGASGWRWMVTSPMW